MSKAFFNLYLLYDFIGWENFHIVTQATNDTEYIFTASKLHTNKASKLL